MRARVMPASHRLPGSDRALRNSALQLPARGDVQLAEDLAQMPFHGTWAEEQPSPDFWVGQALAGEADDLCLLRGELAIGFHGALARGLAGGQQFPSSPL